MKNFSYFMMYLTNSMIEKVNCSNYESQGLKIFHKQRITSKSGRLFIPFNNNKLFHDKKCTREQTSAHNSREKVIRTD